MNKTLFAVTAVVCALPVQAHGAETPDPSAKHTTAFVADVRFGGLFRSNTDYFHQAETFGYPVPSVAGGVDMTLGVEVLPRFSVFALGGYYGHGATREGFGKLMLTSEELLLGARYAFLRTEVEKMLMAQLEGWAGGGRYWIKETYVDPLLSATTYQRNGASAGFAVGVDASVNIAVTRIVVGYAYHYAPASISNEIGGVARAGGHEVSIGLGIRL